MYPYKGLRTQAFSKVLKHKGTLSNLKPPHIYDEPIFHNGGRAKIQNGKEQSLQ